MAIFRASAVVGAISGTIGSTTFVHTGASKVVRRRPNKTDAQSPKQLLQRVRLRVVQNLWPTLTAAQRQAWITHALIFSASNRLGVQRPISGWQYFLKINLLQLSADLTLTIIPPLGFVTQPLESAAWTNLQAALLLLTAVIPGPAPSPAVQVFAQRSFSVNQQLSWTNLTLLGNYINAIALYNVTADFIALLGTPGTNEWIAARVHPQAPPAPPGPGILIVGQIVP